MKFVSVLAMAVLAGSSFSLVGQQPDQASQQTPATSAPATQSTPQGNPASANPASADAAGTSTREVEMRPVKGELVGNLDSKSAKTGDKVVVKTEESLKTADGTVIPKGSKLVGHVSKVQSHSQGSENSAMGIQFDHAELKGGQSVEIQSVIKSLAPAPGDMGSSAVDSMSSPMGVGAAPGGGTAGRPRGGTTANTGSIATTAQPESATAATNGPSIGGAANAGTVVGKTGDDPIRTTAIPGLFLASTTPGEASTLSGMLFAAKSEVRLEGGTQVGMEVAVAAAR